MMKRRLKSPLEDQVYFLLLLLLFLLLLMHHHATHYGCCSRRVGRLITVNEHWLIRLCLGGLNQFNAGSVQPKGNKRNRFLCLVKKSHDLQSKGSLNQVRASIYDYSLRFKLFFCVWCDFGRTSAQIWIWDKLWADIYAAHETSKEAKTASLSVERLKSWTKFCNKVNCNQNGLGKDLKLISHLLTI